MSLLEQAVSNGWLTRIVERYVFWPLTLDKKRKWLTRARIIQVKVDYRDVVYVDGELIPYVPDGEWIDAAWVD